MPSYLRFEEVDKGARKTRIVAVRAVRDGAFLGQVAWFGRWRQYAFFPRAKTVFNPTCLEEVNERIQSLMAERRAK